MKTMFSISKIETFQNMHTVPSQLVDIMIGEIAEIFSSNWNIECIITVYRLFMHDTGDGRDEVAERASGRWRHPNLDDVSEFEAGDVNVDDAASMGPT